MYKLHCDLCEKDISTDENTTKMTWEDNNGYDVYNFFTHRKPRKFTVDICDDCLKKLKEKAHLD